MFLVVGKCQVSDLKIESDTEFVTIEQNPLEVSVKDMQEGKTPAVYVLIPNGGPSAEALAQEFADYLRVTFDLEGSVWRRRRIQGSLNRLAFGRERIVPECFSRSKVLNQSREGE